MVSIELLLNLIFIYLTIFYRLAKKTKRFFYKIGSSWIMSQDQKKLILFCREASVVNKIYSDNDEKY